MLQKLILLGLLLLTVGCQKTTSPESHSSPKELTSELSNDSSQLENDPKNAFTQSNSISLENPSEASSNLDTSQPMDSVLQIPNDAFVTTIDSIFANLNTYIGHPIQFEGFVVRLDETQYAVTRFYDLMHEDHEDRILVGLNGLYDGDWPEENTWVEVTGTIQKASEENRGDYPIVKINNLVIKEERGQELVTN